MRIDIWNWDFRTFREAIAESESTDDYHNAYNHAYMGRYQVGIPILRSHGIYESGPGDIWGHTPYLLSMGFILAAMDTFVPAAIREFRSTNPGIEIRLHELGTLAQLDAPRRRPVSRWESCGFFQQETAGLVVEQNRAGTLPIGAAGRASPDFIAGCVPRIVQETTTKATAIALAAAGIGAALVPASAQKQQRSGVVYPTYCRRSAAGRAVIGLARRRGITVRAQADRYHTGNEKHAGPISERLAAP